MADNNFALGPLPNGWECRNDPRTRRNYFINYNNKTTTWEDPRACATVLNAPPSYHTPATEEVTLQDISSYRPSPVPSRAHTAPLMGSYAIGHHSSSKIYETSFNSAVATEQSVAKISAMFPTVSESHIRALLIKYMKSMFPKADETIILDTLYNVDNNVQAATTQLQAMGYDKRDSTSSLAGTPSKLKEVGKVTKSEKEREKLLSTPTTSARLRSVEEKQAMRDRLKKSHPDLAEQLISMALDSVDYDENRASHILNIMIKEESNPKSTPQNSAASSQRPQSSKSADTEVSSLGTKTTMEADVAVFSSEKSNETKEVSNEIAGSSQQPGLGMDTQAKSEKNNRNEQSVVAVPNASEPTGKLVSTNATVHSSPNKTSITNIMDHLLPRKTSIKKMRGKKEVPKVSRGTSTTEDKEYRSQYRLTPAGPNSTLHHGPNDELLIEDYVTWSGPSRHSRANPSIAEGPNKNLLRSQCSQAKGPNREVCKGPQKGLAKGSLFSQLAACNAGTTLVAVESRGK